MIYLLLFLIPLLLSKCFLLNFEKLIKYQIADVEQIKHLENKILRMNEVSSLKEKKNEENYFLIACLNFAYLMTMNVSLVCPFIPSEVVLYFK